MPKEMRVAEQRAVRKSALAVTGGVRDEIRAATGDMRLSGVGRRGAKVGARYTVAGAKATIRATGPLQLIERPTRPHPIAPRKRRNGKRKALRLADGRFVASVQHPGTRGKYPWSKGIEKTRGKSRATFEAEVRNAMIRAVR